MDVLIWYHFCTGENSRGLAALYLERCLSLFDRVSRMRRQSSCVAIIQRGREAYKKTVPSTNNAYESIKAVLLRGSELLVLRLSTPLNAGVCMLPSLRWCCLPMCQHTSSLPSATGQHLTPIEDQVWLDAIDKTVVWDGLLSRPRGQSGPAAMNHLNRDQPSRRQTLNTSAVVFL